MSRLSTRGKVSNQARQTLEVIPPMRRTMHLVCELPVAAVDMGRFCCNFLHALIGKFATAV